MKKYTYRFGNGTKSVVEVPDELYEKLVEMDKEEQKNKYNYNRHNVPLSAFTYDGEDFADKGDTLDEKIIRDEDIERVRMAISALTDKQQELVRMVYYERIPIVKIASIQGVNKSAICNRLTRIKEKLKKILA